MTMIIILINIPTFFTLGRDIDCYYLLAIILFIIAVALVIWSLVSRINYITENNIEKKRWKRFKDIQQGCSTIECIENAAIDAGYDRNHRILKFLNKAKKCNNHKCVTKIVY